jgi:hypothetical protein
VADINRQHHLALPAEGKAQQRAGEQNAYPDMRQQEAHPSATRRVEAAGRRRNGQDTEQRQEDRRAKYRSLAATTRRQDTRQQEDGNEAEELNDSQRTHGRALFRLPDAAGVNFDFEEQFVAADIRVRQRHG